MKFRSSMLAVPVALAAVFGLLSCSADPVSTRPGDGGTSGSSTGAVSGGGTGGSSAGSGSGGTSGSSTGAVGGGGAGAGGSSAGGGAGGSSPGGLGGGGAGGSSGGSGGMGELEPTFATVKSIIQMSCFGGLCHDIPEHPLQLTVNDTLYMRLTTHQTEDCGPLLTPGNVAQSALVTVLKEECNDTPRMPYGDCYDDPAGGADCLTPEKIAAIEEWVANGAPEE